MSDPCKYQMLPISEETLNTHLRHIQAVFEAFHITVLELIGLYETFNPIAHGKTEPDGLTLAEEWKFEAHVECGCSPDGYLII